MSDFDKIFWARMLASELLLEEETLPVDAAAYLTAHQVPVADQPEVEQRALELAFDHLL